MITDRNGDAEDVALCESVDRDDNRCNHPARFQILHGLTGLHSLACGVHKSRGMREMGTVIMPIDSKK